MAAEVALARANSAPCYAKVVESENDLKCVIRFFAEIESLVLPFSFCSREIANSYVSEINSCLGALGERGAYLEAIYAPSKAGQPDLVSYRINNSGWASTTQRVCF
jgi:hypothetical protein